MHMTTLVAPPTALSSDRYGRLFASVPGARGGLFVVDDGSGETRRFIDGGVSRVAASRDDKLFVARGAAILQVDLDAAWAVTDVSDRFACSGTGPHTLTGNRDGSVGPRRSPDCQELALLAGRADVAGRSRPADAAVLGGRRCPRWQTLRRRRGALVNGSGFFHLGRPGIRPAS